MSENRWTKKLINWGPREDKRSRGGTATKWHDGVNRDFKVESDI